MAAYTPSYDCGVGGSVKAGPNSTGVKVEIPGVTWTVGIAINENDMTNFMSRGYFESTCGVIKIDWSFEVKPESTFQLEAAANGLVIGKLVDLELVKSATQKYTGVGRIMKIDLGNDENGAPTINISGTSQGPTWTGPGLPALPEEPETP